MNPPTIADFKARGFTVKVEHLRPVILDETHRQFLRYLPPKQLARFVESQYMGFSAIRRHGFQHLMHPRGGTTTVHLLRSGETKWSEFESRCSAKDLFSRKTGIMKCLYRASVLLKAEGST